MEIWFEATPARLFALTGTMTTQTTKAKKLIRRLLMRIAKPAHLEPPPDISPAIIEPARPKPATRKPATIKTVKRMKPPPGAGKTELLEFTYKSLQTRLIQRLKDKGIVTTDTPPPIVKPKPKGRLMDNIGKIFDYNQPTATRRKHISETA